MSLIFLLIGGIFALLGDPDIGLVLCVPAAIAGCFSIFYGILWGVFVRKEQKRQRKIERAAQMLLPRSDDVVTDREFILPGQELIRASKSRLQKITAALLVSGGVVSVILYGILYLSNGFGGIGHLISVFVFCFLMMIPGILVQYIIFRKYARSVPERIRLFPDKIIINGQQYCTREVERITVSSFNSVNKDTSVLYRKLIIRTKDRTREYTIDYRFASEEAPRWSEYGEFLMSLRFWAEQNRVRLTVDYMN